MFLGIGYSEDPEKICQFQDIVNGRPQSEENEIFLQVPRLFKYFQ